MTERLPAAANKLLEGIPEVVQVGDLSLNISLASRPLVTPDSVTLFDWGRFFPDPSASQDCPYASGPASSSVPPKGGVHLPAAPLFQPFYILPALLRRHGKGGRGGGVGD